MDSKTISCAAVAAVSLGVTIGLAASSTTSLHVPAAAQTAVTARAAGVAPQSAQRVSAPRPVSTVLQASEDGVADMPVTTASGNWALGALVSAGAAAGALYLAMRQRASNAYESILDDPEAAMGNAGRALGAVAVSAALAGSANAASLTFDEIKSLSYMEVKGTGLANTCPIISPGTGDRLNLGAGNYKIENMCIEPSSFQVKVPSTDGKPTEFEKTKLMTRLTYTLDGIRADLNVGIDGSWNVKEIDGIDYAATTVQLAGGERVPFLFTVKNLAAKGDAGQFIGQFDVPSYRGGTFLDPKGRGGATGYDTAVALPAAGDSEKLLKENIKNMESGVGTIAFKVAKVNSETGEVAGVFESIQPSDTDMGAKVPKDIKASGVWYGQISKA